VPCFGYLAGLIWGLKIRTTKPHQTIEPLEISEFYWLAAGGAKTSKRDGLGCKPSPAKASKRDGLGCKPSPAKTSKRDGLGCKPSPAKVY
jgi:hypothetical protein